MTIIIGVTGLSGSGKTTFTNLLAKILTASVISQDDFYIGAKAMVRQNSGLNFDSLAALDMNGLILSLEEIKNGTHSSIEIPNYNYSTQSRDGFKNIYLQQIVLIEGHLIFTSQDVLDLVDFNIYMDVDRSTAKARRFTRDVAVRGYEREECEAYYYKYVIQTLDTIESLKRKADYVIDAGPWGDNYNSQIEKMLALAGRKGRWFERD